MIHKINQIKFKIFLVILIQVLIVVGLKLFFEYSIFSAITILIMESSLIYYVFYIITNEQVKHNLEMSELLGDGSKEAFVFGEVGIIVYDDNYIINWMSDLFIERGINRIGKKLLVWIPEVDSLITGKEDVIYLSLDERKYEVRRREDSKMLYFKDITKSDTYKKHLEDEQMVLGLVNFDNYEESTRYEDEVFVSNVNTEIKVPVVEYAREKGILIKKINDYKYILILNEKIFSKLVEDKFSILHTVKLASNKLDLSITLSMAFARGSNKYNELDEKLSELMELAQNRGGDQVAVCKIGEEVKYFGGSTEATEKRSRVKVRVIAHTLRHLIQKSSNIIICMHKDADFDCMGSAICLSKIAHAYNKNVSIISKTGGIEPKLKETLEKYKNDFNFNFISENEAINQLKNDSLVIMVDHHNIKQSNGLNVLEKAKKIVVIDHHRRSANLNIKPMLIYIEAAASSTCELVCEFIPYLSNKIDITDKEANIMLAGMIIDTNHFKVRTGTRTYDAASYLRSLGADPVTVDEYIKDTYDEFELKSLIMSKAVVYKNDIIIASISDKIVSRSIISQSGDMMLSIKGVEAAFIISKISNDEVGISARSNGKINVQIIMEKMNGGGHMTAAGVQRKMETVENIELELKQVIDDFLNLNKE